MPQYQDAKDAREKLSQVCTLLDRIFDERKAGENLEAFEEIRDLLGGANRDIAELRGRMDEADTRAGEIRELFVGAKTDIEALGQVLQNATRASVPVAPTPTATTVSKPEGSEPKAPASDKKA